MKNQKGITLIALIITIIVMLILVGVSVTVALNGGVFETAKKAVDDTKTARDEELLIDADGYIAAVQNKIAVGTEVTIGETGENFYVIKDEGAKLILLAKKNIRLDIETQKYKQADGNNSVIFANVDTSYSYWSTYTGTYPLNLNEYGACPEGSAIDIAKQYAEEITGNRDNGRLMTLEEVHALGGDSDNSNTEDYPDFINSGADYWLGTADDESYVWIVDGHHNILSRDVFFADYYWDSNYGVRPVIEISESSVTEVQ